MVEEKTPLISKPIAETGATSGKQSYAMNLNEEGGNTEREWDGPLWKMCGDCDQAGLSTFAYVKMCTPLAFGHNLQRAFGKGFWIHAIVFTLLFCTWGYALMGTNVRVQQACGLNHPPHHLPEPMPRPVEPQQPGLRTDPEQQQFLAGATFNPQFMEEKQDPEGADVWVTVEGSDLAETESTKDEQAPTKAPEDELVSLDQDVIQQLQNAKLQAAEGMANLGIGRKMLHKHDHDDDDDHEHKHKGEHKHKHDDKDDDHHKDKKHPKKHDESKKEEPKGWKTPKDEIDGPPHGLETPECHDATVSMGALVVAMAFSGIVGIAYAAKLRTAIRKQHGIKGTKCQDCLAWTFCAPCALCQETRTLAKNNVQNGTWYGATVLMEAGQQPLDAPKPVEAPTKPV